MYCIIHGLGANISEGSGGLWTSKQGAGRSIPAPSTQNRGVGGGLAFESLGTLAHAIFAPWITMVRTYYESCASQYGHVFLISRLACLLEYVPTHASGCIFRIFRSCTCVSNMVLVLVPRFALFPLCGSNRFQCG